MVAKSSPKKIRFITQDFRDVVVINLIPACCASDRPGAVTQECSDFGQLQVCCSSPKKGWLGLAWSKLCPLTFSSTCLRTIIKTNSVNAWPGIEPFGTVSSAIVVSGVEPFGLRLW